jgi:hypothetical protein
VAIDRLLVLSQEGREVGANQSGGPQDQENQYRALDYEVMCPFKKLHDTCADPEKGGCSNARDPLRRGEIREWDHGSTRSSPAIQTYNECCG